MNDPESLSKSIEASLSASQTRRVFFSLRPGLPPSDFFHFSCPFRYHAHFPHLSISYQSKSFSRKSAGCSEAALPALAVSFAQTKYRSVEAPTVSSNRHRSLRAYRRKYGKV